MTNVNNTRGIASDYSGFVINLSFVIRISSLQSRRPGMPSPPVILLISDWVSPLPCSTACFTALKTISSRNSTSFGSTTSLSILIARTSPAPFAVTFTFPPPALTSTVLLSSSACVLAICSCIFCACFISLLMFMVFGLRYPGGRALSFLDYLSIEQPYRFFNKRIAFKIFRSRTLGSQRLFGRKFFIDDKPHTPVRSGDLMEQRLKKFAIGLRSQDIHHRFVVRRETKLEIAPFDPKDMGCRSRISHEGLLRGNFSQSLLPEL